MSDVQASLAHAFQLHQSGRVREAIEGYRAIHASLAENGQFLFLLGTAYGQVGQLAQSIETLDQSIGLNAENPEAFHNLGAALEASGRVGLSLLCYEKATALKPDYAQAHYARGNALKKMQRLDDALASYRAAIRIEPHYAEPFNNCGVIYGDRNQLSQALACFDEAITRKEDFAEARNNRGNVLCGMKRFGEAFISFDQAIALRPEYALAWSNRGNALMNLKRLEEALASYNEAIVLKPDLPEAFNNRGLVLQGLGRLKEALESYDQAITLKQDYAEAYLNRGHLFMVLRCFDQALVSYEKANLLKPDLPFLQGARLHSKMHLCQWEGLTSDIEATLGRIDRQELAIQPFALMALLDDPVRHRLAAERFVNHATPITERYPSHQVGSPSKIRLGYYSADFYDHATSHLMVELFEHHDASRFDTYAFSFGPLTGDPWHARVIGCFHEFIDCSGLSDEEVVQISRRLGIHVAVDLKGFTQDARPGIFNGRAAPIQVNFLGYPGTMGADYIDYIIADETIIPEACRSYYSEKVALLSQCYQPNRRIIPDHGVHPARMDYGVPPVGFVFCSFNNNYKITPEIFGCWINLLKAVEGSVLWLLATNPTAANNLREAARCFGVDPGRLIFAPRLPHEQHMNRLRLGDLMLDTFPCGAHTTSSDALRVGLPLVTLRGKSFASRVASSLLMEMGLPELIGNSLEEYEAIAIRLATQASELLGLRERLMRTLSNSPLFDPQRYTVHLEYLFSRMLERHNAGLLPEDISG